MNLDLWSEEKLKENPYDVKLWYDYLELDVVKSSSLKNRYILYERALYVLPWSYKLWKSYLDCRVASLSLRRVTDKRVNITITIFERALEHLSKMPRIWLDYIHLLINSCKVTKTRKVFDRALQTLPITQHDKIWILYIKWSRKNEIPIQTIQLYNRYIQLMPSEIENFISFLESTQVCGWGLASKLLLRIVQDISWKSSKGTTKLELWLHLCDLCSNHPNECSKAIDVDTTIRQGISKYSNEVGKLWCRLASYYARLGAFEDARGIYAEAIGYDYECLYNSNTNISSNISNSSSIPTPKVSSVRDFSIVFDSMVRFEESLLTAKMNLLETLEDEPADDDSGNSDDEDDESDESVEDREKEKGELSSEIESIIARLEQIIDARSLLLSAVKIHISPHDCNEWRTLTKLYEPLGPAKMAAVVRQGLRTVDPMKVEGKLSSLYMLLTDIITSSSNNTGSDVEDARQIWRQSLQVQYNSGEEAARLACMWAEWEIMIALGSSTSDQKRQGLEKALALVQQMILRRKNNNNFTTMAGAKSNTISKNNIYEFTAAIPTPCHDLSYHVRLWQLYLDLSENVGTLATTRAAYDHSLDVKVATPSIVLSYATMLQDNHYYEDSFRVFQRGIDLFEGKFPHCDTIWRCYLEAFESRYQGSKLERLRDLYEQCIHDLPSEYCSNYYTRYALVEERYGLARHVISILERSLSHILLSEKFNMYRLLCSKIQKHFGITKSRPVYESAIAGLVDHEARQMCLDYAKLETKMGEIDRARAIYQHGSQFADPRLVTDYYSQWQVFEQAHGNEDTFRNMLRIKRSIEVANAQTNYLVEELRQKEQDKRKKKIHDRDDNDNDIERNEIQQPSKMSRTTNNGNSSGIAIEGFQRSVRDDRRTSDITATTSNNNNDPGTITTTTATTTTITTTSHPDDIDIDVDDGDEEDDDNIPAAAATATATAEPTVPSAVYGTLESLVTDMTNNSSSIHDDDGQGEESLVRVGAKDGFKSNLNNNDDHDNIADDDAKTNAASTSKSSRGRGRGRGKSGGRKK